MVWVIEVKRAWLHRHRANGRRLKRPSGRRWRLGLLLGFYRGPWRACSLSSWALFGSAACRALKLTLASVALHLLVFLLSFGLRVLGWLLWREVRSRHFWLRGLLRHAGLQVGLTSFELRGLERVLLGGDTAP